MKYQLASYDMHLARGGGGGSSSGGGGGGGGGGFSGGSSHSSGSSGSGGGDIGWGGVLFILFSGVGLYLIILALTKSKGSSGAFKMPFGYYDPQKDSQATLEQKEAATRGGNVFELFQNAWSDFDLELMQKVTSPEFYKKMVLELNVLKNYQRQNKMSNVNISGVFIKKDTFSIDGFSVFITASATDELIDLKDNKVIFTDNSSFSEYWHFVRVGGNYVLDKIEQATADASKRIPAIEQFAQSNKFYYDTDFGWLMMPSRGAIFGPTGFGQADINNHVIGYYKDKIVEFYSFEPKAGVGMKPFVVAQAILPKSYDDILVTEKSWYNFKPKQQGLTKIETESVDFNKKFAVWAADTDKATSFELLATNFMERIYALEYEINIEVVDNVLYLYSPDANIVYDQLLQILDWAFDEMKL